VQLFKVLGQGEYGRMGAAIAQRQAVRAQTFFSKVRDTAQVSWALPEQGLIFSSS
jgi:hypothetical protein